MNRMYVVHWEINGSTGHGSPISVETAKDIAELGNAEFGNKTHWIIREGLTLSSPTIIENR